MTATPANPFAGLGLPPTWQPGPFAWTFGKLDAVTDRGPITFHVLIFDGPSGRTAFALQPEAMRQFLDQATAQLSGLEIARTIVPHVGNGHAGAG